MKRALCLVVTLSVLTACVPGSLHSPQHSQPQQNGNVKHIPDYGLSDAEKSKQILEHESRRKRSSGDVYLDAENDLDDLLGTPSVPLTINLESLPPIIRYLVEQKLKEQRSRLTPRLGRDIDCEDCQRTRPPFAPRLGKKSIPFKPRLGRRQSFEDTRGGC